MLLYKKSSILAYAGAMLCCLIGCSPEAQKVADGVGELERSYVIEEISDVGDFGSFYTSLKSALKRKQWKEVFEMIPEKDRKYFKGAEDFSSYMDKNNRLWELAVLNELSSELEYDEAGIRKIEIYFEAQILPGPTRHNSSLEFFRNNANWTVSGLERLRLSPITFEY